MSPCAESQRVQPGGALRLAFPLAVLGDVGGGGAGEVEALRDQGWMARDLSAKGEELAALQAAAAAGKFVIFNADNI